jgi:hypothetical protein
MNYSSINLRKISKDELIKRLIDGEINVPSSMEKKEIQTIIESFAGQNQYFIAINSLILGMFFDKDKTFFNIRKKGTFRYSKYISNKCFVQNLAKDLLDFDKKFGLYSANDVKYLNSIINLSGLHNSYNEIQKYIFGEIKFFHLKYKEKSLIKSLLSYVDFLFLSNYYPESITDPLEITSRTKEDICSAISYLIYIITEKSSFTITDTMFVSEEYIKSGEISRIIIAACFISDFKEFEILIDHFNYECIEINDNIKIIPPNEDFEKSIRLGYIRNQLQYNYDKIDAKEVASIEDLVDEINKHPELSIFQLTETHNYPRYTLQIPELFFERLVVKFFKPDFLFREELIYLSHIFKEQLLNANDLKQIMIRGELSLMEFIKIRRVF